ncbi:MAG: transcription antitermination factor NusB [Deltaproteobacteria bacterium CG11_big_fil_rev_8_21_14_0_20_47_16]|nr:MAG: transcription antitermination factor NusB [Deltaproteobacteria bacterium CG11_big_fil_rev_8_21_14_0_20_47_16]
MGNRRKGREAALQFLFQRDMSGAVDTQTVIHYWEENPADSETREFANRLLLGTVEKLADIDQHIGQFSSHWKLGRMAAVDRNLLRLAIFELAYCPDIPMKVTMNEAIEIAKKFGSEESGAFVNGILDQIAKTVKK